MLIIVLTGNFKNFFSYFSLLFLHELGHSLMGIILGYQLDRIIFYPYGGVTTFNMPLNIPLKNELLVLLAGPFFQIIAYYLLKRFFNNLDIYHYSLLIFNLLPIYPLDGGKIFNILCNYSFNYLKSFTITFILSIFFLFILIIYSIQIHNFNLLLMVIVLFIKCLEFYKKRFYYYERFLLERYLHQYSFSKFKNIKNIKNFYRDTHHYINYQEEKIILKKHFIRCKNTKM